MKKAILSIGLIAGLAACSEETRQELGLVNTPPDEFSVITRAPLSVPPDYALRPPRPGAQRPMEISPVDQARQTVFGARDIQQDGVARENSAQAAGFLNKIGANDADPNIRAVVDTEDPVDNRSTVQRILMVDNLAETGEPINPNEEFERLKEEGVVTIKKRTEAPPAP